MTKIAVFASGRGSNFKNIYQKIRDGFLTCQVTVFITDNENAPALSFAKEQQIPSYVVSPKWFDNQVDFGRELLTLLKRYGVDFIVLAGYLKKIPDNVVEAYENRIVNIHPALLPAFGGKGMYGMHVHQAVWLAGVKVSGVTVHLVNTEYDAGPIVMQRCVDISDCMSPGEIAERVLAVEHQIYPEALKWLFENDWKVNGKRVVFKTGITHD